MTEIEKLLKNIVLGGVGAVATVVEQTGKAARTVIEHGDVVASRLVSKGEEAVRAGRDLTEELRRKVETAVDEAVKAAEECGAKEEETPDPETREALRQTIDDVQAHLDQLRAMLEKMNAEAATDDSEATDTPVDPEE